MSSDLERRQEEGFRKLMDAIFAQSLASAEKTIDEAEKKALATIEESERFALQAHGRLHRRRGR